MLPRSFFGSKSYCTAAGSHLRQRSGQGSRARGRGRRGLRCIPRDGRHWRHTQAKRLALQHLALQVIHEAARVTRKPAPSNGKCCVQRVVGWRAGCALARSSDREHILKLMSISRQQCARCPSIDGVLQSSHTAVWSAGRPAAAAHDLDPFKHCSCCRTGGTQAEEQRGGGRRAGRRRTFWGFLTDSRLRSGPTRWRRK